MTLEKLFDSAENNQGAYGAAREAKVTEIAEYIGSFLIDHDAWPAFTEGLADEIMTAAEESGRIFGDTIQGEVPRRYTKSGNPLPFSL